MSWRDCSRSWGRALTVAPDSLVSLLSGALCGHVGTRLSTTALDAMIAHGHFASIESGALRQKLAEWLSMAVDQRIQQRENTRVRIRETQTYAQMILPYALLDGRGVSSLRQESRFSLDVGLVLGDPTFEGALVRLAGWRGAIGYSDGVRREELNELLSGIDAELSR